MERYVNNFSTTVGVLGYTAGSGVLNVASTSGISLGSGDTVHLAVYTVTLGVISVVVNLTATAVNSGTQFAVTAEGADANAAATDVVICVLSAGSMNQIRADVSNLGTFANLPATTNRKLGDDYKSTDSPHHFRFDGTLWQPFWEDGQNIALPIPGNFAWQSQGSATLVTTFGTLRVARTASEASFNVHAQVMTAPSTPYHIILGVQTQGSLGANVGAGICVSDGTQYELFYPGFVSGGVQIVIFFNTSNTVNSSTPYNVAGGPAPWSAPPIWYVRVGDDGTNKTFDVGPSPSGPWTAVFSEGRTTHLTISKVGVFVNGGPATVECFHVAVTA